MGRLDRYPALVQSEVVALFRRPRLDLHAEPIEAGSELAGGEVRCVWQNQADDRSGRRDLKVDGAAVEDLRSADVDVPVLERSEDPREAALQIQGEGELGIGRSSGEAESSADLSGSELVR